MNDLGNILLRDYRPRPTLHSPVPEVSRAWVAAIDAHTHLGRLSADEPQADSTDDWRVPDVATLIANMDAANVRTLVNLDGQWQDRLEANLDRYDRAYPARFTTFCRLNWDICREPGWPAHLERSLEDSAVRGAAGLKIAKDLGLSIRDDSDRLLLPDDERLDDIWYAAGELHLPVLIHTADAAAFFEPQNERLLELLRNPSWHVAGPGYPSMARLLRALEQVVANHPATTFIGAHVGCYAENLHWVDRMLNIYPNFYIDIAARISEFGRQPRASVRMIARHPARVLFGTDGSPPTRRAFATYYRFFETDDEHFPYSDSQPPQQGQWAISGLALDKEYLAGLYHDNAHRILGNLDESFDPFDSSTDESAADVGRPGVKMEGISR